ncbi:MAG: hypothetical protein IJ669_01035 [Prevotella sp.]|nr:hypothetical protein [Prevotella sp.]
MKNRKNLFGRNLGMLIAAAFFTLVDCIPLQAQEVTIHAGNGSLLPAVKDGGITDVFYDLNGFATWKHNQLTLTMTTADSDKGNLTEYGQLANPANNIFKGENDKLVIGRGSSMDCYVAICLPKGYRFTGYTITFSRNANIDGGASGQATFGETDENFAYGSRPQQGGMSYSPTAPKYTISRTSMSENDMDNTLYFKLTNNQEARAFITLDYVELQFTAEADYTPFSPATTVNNRTAVDIPFSTSKVDYGEISRQKYSNSTRMSYSSAHVQDLEAYLTLYEEESVEKRTNDFDGTYGNMVKYSDNGTIRNYGDYFKLGREDGEQIYYLETPTYVTLPDGKTKSPIGYRIVSASIDYNYGDTIPVTFKTFYISAIYTSGLSQKESIAYLNSNGGVSTSQGDAAVWFMDEDGYIRLLDDPNIILRNGSNNYIEVITSTSSSSPTKFAINNFGEITLVQNPQMYLSLSYTSYYGYRFRMVHENSNPNKAKRTVTGTKTFIYTGTGYEPSTFTLNVYDKTGQSVEKTVTVDANSVEKTGTLTIEGLNNDAIKIGVQGIGLIKGSLTLQALDPYINSLDIVCHEVETDAQGNPKKDEEGKTIFGAGRKLSQGFKAKDFSVRGGEFNFYVPKDFDLPCMFTFENLFSNYGDDTYYGGKTNGNSRYSLVWSPYFQSIGADPNPERRNIYATDPDEPYENKIWTELVGQTPFKFNNATTIDQTGGMYIEYPFTPAKYGEDKFEYFIFTQDDMNEGNAKIAYLFTSDETRYNIAPTWGTQHVYYAYYEMKITLNKKTYDPVLTWTKVYDEDKTLYMDNDGKPASKSQWGAKLTTSEKVDGEFGYLSVSQVLDEINNGVGKDNAPETKEQILYIDGSELLNLVEETKKLDNGTTKEYKLSDLRDGTGANSIIYLPKDATTESDNFAYKTETGFRGARDFVITDRKPFYAPYDIQIDAANYCTYQRELEVEQNGDVKLAKGSIILPFVLSVDEKGYHVNVDGTKPFSVHEMQADNCIGPKDEQDDTQNVYFPAISGVTATKANTPYIIKIDDVEDQVVELPFVATQKGTRIIATTGMDKDNYTFPGMQATGTTTPTAKTPETATYNFQSLGTYAGAKLSIEDETNYFYFSHNYLVCTKNLDKDLEYAYILPFRTYYPTSTTRVATFGVIFGEGEGNTDPTGINNVDETPDLVVAPGVGTITMASTIEQGVKIYNMNGVLVDKVVMGAGETKTVNIPAGMYIVNGTKLIVR